jgi:hypothetical protein
MNSEQESGRGNIDTNVMTHSGNVPPLLYRTTLLSIPIMTMSHGWTVSCWHHAVEALKETLFEVGNLIEGLALDVDEASLWRQRPFVATCNACCVAKQRPIPKLQRR